MTDCKHGLDEATCYTCRNRVSYRGDGFPGKVPPREMSDDDQPWQRTRRSIVAKYDGRCEACDEDIVAGIDRIVYNDEWEAWVHDTHGDGMAL